jgi:hypothetical protein
MSTSTLQEGLKRAATRRAIAQQSTKKRTATKSPKAERSRAGTVLIGGHFDVSVKQRLLSIRAEHPERTMQDLLEEALDLLFQQHKQPRMR